MSKGPSPKVTLTIDADLRDAFFQMMWAHGFGSIPDYINALIREKLSSDPERASLTIARRRAYQEARAWSLTQIRNSLQSVSLLLESAISEEGTLDESAERDVEDSELTF